MSYICGFARTSQGSFHLELFVYAAGGIREDGKLAACFSGIRVDARRVAAADNYEPSGSGRRRQRGEGGGGDMRRQGLDILLIGGAEEVAY